MALPRVTQLNIVHGSAQEEGPYTFVQSLSQDGEPSCLFLLFEVDGPTPQEACQRATELYLETFEGSRLSTTGRLLEGLRTVHEAVLWENRHSMPDQQITLGALAVYLRGEDVYLAHAGPSLAYVIGPKGARHLAPAPGSPSPRLGAVSEPPVWVRHHHFAPHEVMLLATSCLASDGNERELLASFQGSTEDGMVAVYRWARGNQEFAAMTIDPGTSAKAPAISQDIASPASMPRQASSSAPPDAVPVYAYGYGREQTPRNTGRDRAAKAPQLLDSPLHLGLELREPQRWVRNHITDLLPPRVMFSLLLVFILGGLFLGARAVAQQMQEGSREEAARLIQTAQELQAQAQQTDAGDEKRSLMNQALQQLASAQKYDAGNPSASALEQRIRTGLTELDASFQLEGLSPVLELGGGGASQPLLRELAPYGNGFYLLDKSNDRILQAPLSELDHSSGQYTPPVLGPASGSARRNLTTLVWLAKGGTWPRDSLLALDSNRNILEFNASNAAPLPMRGAQEWASFQAAVGFGGNLYVLDSRGSQVWRYTPTDSGFDTERRAALPSVDLRDAVDLVVDGDIYVLLRAGEVLKFSSGRAQPFSLDGLDKPMLNPVSIFTDASADAVYVVDAGNSRIAVFQKEDGRFLKQFPLPSSPTIHDLWVDGEKGTIYLVSDSSVYRATLPGR